MERLIWCREGEGFRNDSDDKGVLGSFACVRFPDPAITLDDIADVVVSFGDIGFGQDAKGNLIGRSGDSAKYTGLVRGTPQPFLERVDHFRTRTTGGEHSIVARHHLFRKWNTRPQIVRFKKLKQVVNVWSGHCG
jgi:hypothetical protein